MMYACFTCAKMRALGNKLLVTRFFSSSHSDDHYTLLVKNSFGMTGPCIKFMMSMNYLISARLACTNQFCKKQSCSCTSECQLAVSL